MASDQEDKPRWYRHYQSADGLEKYEEIPHGTKPERRRIRACYRPLWIGAYSLDNELMPDPTGMFRNREYEYAGAYDGVNGTRYFIYRERL